MKALVTSRSFGKFCPEAIDYLEKNGIEMDYFQNGPGTPDSIAEKVKDAHILIVGNDPITKEVMDSGKNLKLIHMHGTGLDGIDLEYAKQRGIEVSNVNGVNKNAVAELTVALMLIAGRRIDKHIAGFRDGIWKRQAGHEVSGSNVGIIGLGNIGKRVVELLRGFDVKVTAYDVNPDWSWLEVPNRISIVETIDEVLSTADFLVLACPLNQSTEKMINRESIARMKKNAIIINTSRGGLIDEQALAEAVNEGRIGGAALDAFSEEPLPDNSILKGLDIVLTPHMAATSIETSSKVSMTVAENVVKLLSKEKAC